MGSVFITDLVNDVNFIKSMIRDFKKKFRTSIFQFQYVGLCTTITFIHFFEIEYEDLENDNLFCRFLSFRSDIDSRDSLNDMRCSLDGECFQYRFGHESHFFKN